MKHLIPLIASFLVLGSGLQAQSRLANAITPHLELDERMVLRDRLIYRILNEAKSGSNVLLVDAWSGNVITDIEVPRLRVDSDVARQRHLRAKLASIVRWFENPPVYPGLEGTGAINLPRVVAALERHNFNALLVVGSPIYLSPDDPAQTWLVTEPDPVFVYPPDVAFFVTGGASPWAVQRDRDRLGGASVHWLLTGSIAYPPGAYTEGVKRFLSLYIKLENGELVSFLPDQEEAFNGLENRVLRGFEYTLDLRDQSLAMRRVVVEPAPVPGVVEPAEIIIPEDLRTNPIRRVIVIDITMSMEPVFAYVARQVALMAPGENTLMVTYSDHTEPRVVTVYEESKEPSDHARALRSIKLADGVETPEALGDAMHAVRQEIVARGVTEPVEILVWTDAPPKLAEDTPTGVDYAAEMSALLNAGHHLTLFKCRDDQDLTWVPAGVVVRSLNSLQD